MRTLLVALFVVSGCGGVEGIDQQTEELADGPATAHVRYGHDASKPAAKSTGPLIDHGGKVLASSHTYAIWWGPSTGFPSDAQTALPELLAGFNGTSYLGIATQYLRGASATSTFEGSYADGSTPPKGAPNTSAIVSEACKVINANKLTADPNGLYLVFTTNYPKVNYCAWHDHGSCNGVDIQVAYLPNVAGVTGCDPGNLYNCNGFSQGTRAIADGLAHEFMETTTDADISAWYDQNGQEIGDKCNFKYSSCVSVGSSNWQLQQEWSNAAGGCVQQ